MRKMKKLKNKYNWANRNNHLEAAKQDKIIAACLMENLGKYPFAWLLQLHILKDALPLSKTNLTELLDRIQNYHIDYINEINKDT